MSEAPTVAEILAAAGYGYRPSRIEGKQQVFRVADGAVIGDFHALKAAEYAEANPCSSTTPLASDLFLHAGIAMSAATAR